MPSTHESALNKGKGACAGDAAPAGILFGGVRAAENCATSSATALARTRLVLMAPADLYMPSELLVVAQIMRKA